MAPFGYQTMASTGQYSSKMSMKHVKHDMHNTFLRAAYVVATVVMVTI